MIRYEIIIYWSKEDQAFIAEVPELPGCMADGETPEAAIAEGRDALASYVATLRELGRPIPLAAKGTEQTLDEPIAASVQKALARRADAEGISVGALVVRLLAEGLERRTGS